MMTCPTAGDHFRGNDVAVAKVRRMGGSIGYDTAGSLNGTLKDSPGHPGNYQYPLPVSTCG
jgi:hypothetical protein